MHCTQCGTEASGRFCASCGATLGELNCPGCDAALPKGTRFCTSCGTPAATGPRPSPDTTASPGSAALGWWVAGGLLVILLSAGGVFLLSDVGSSGGSANAGQGAALGPAPQVNLAGMTPREAADRLFDRIMRAVSRGDAEEVVNFLPMAIDAHELARPLDDDGLFHLTLLHRVGLEYQAALDVALEGLERTPTHLLLLSSAADAARELGDPEGAHGYYTLLLASWDAELAEGRPEYREHETLLPFIREEAETFLAEGSGGGE